MASNHIDETIADAVVADAAAAAAAADAAAAAAAAAATAATAATYCFSPSTTTIHDQSNSTFVMRHRISLCRLTAFLRLEISRTNMYCSENSKILKANYLFEGVSLESIRYYSMLSALFCSCISHESDTTPVKIPFLRMFTTLTS